VLVAWAVITASTSRWRWLILAHPIVTVFVVVGTGNHYWSDAIVSVAIVAVVLAVQGLLRAKLAGFRRAAPGSRPAPAATTAPLPTGAASVAESSVAESRVAESRVAERRGEKESSQPLAVGRDDKHHRIPANSRRYECSCAQRHRAVSRSRCDSFSGLRTE
jgi:PAP2 superfamily